MVKLQFRVRTLLLVIVPLALIALAVGHHLRRPRRVPASGTVTLDGIPLGEVMMIFQPFDMSGIQATGLTDSAGRFQIKTVVAHASNKHFTGKFLEGAFPGSYRVVFNKYQFPLPKRYEIIVESGGLTAEITRDGPNVFNFNLTTP